MTKLTKLTSYPAESMPRCGEVEPNGQKIFCTHDDPKHEGDHYHEYTGQTWPREPGPK